MCLIVFETCRSTVFYIHLVWNPTIPIVGIVTIVAMSSSPLLLLCLVYVVKMFTSVSKFVEVTLSLPT